MLMTLRLGCKPRPLCAFSSRPVPQCQPLDGESDGSWMRATVDAQQCAGARFPRPSDGVRRGSVLLFGRFSGLPRRAEA